MAAPIVTVGQILPAAALKYGAKTALMFEGRSLSFTELNERSSRLSAGLRAIGVVPGDRVTLYSQNCWEWVVSYYAVAKLGGVLNPINMMLTPEEVLFIVKDCGAKVIIASHDKGAALMDIRCDSPLEAVVLFGDDTPAGTLSFRALLRDSPPEATITTAAPDSLAAIMYTSGTTGHPKGAMLTQRNIVFNGAMTANMHVRTAADTIVTALPLAHAYGGTVMNAAFLCGATLIILRRFEEVAVFEAMSRHRATLFDGVPTMYMYLLSHPGLEKYDLSSLTRCSVGGQTIAVGTMQAIEERFGCPLLELWGMTEIAGVGTTHPFYWENRHGSIGVPLPGVGCRIAAGVDETNAVPANEIGELMIRGPLVMQGYYGNSQATREAITSDGWLHTGDLARMDAEGYVYVVDRKKDMIITAGYNIYPAEIERVIAMHPAVAMVAVGSQPDQVKAEVAKAYVVLKHSTDVQVNEHLLLAFCRQHLAAYKVPRAVQFVTDLPKTSTGKIMRRQLKTLDN